MRKFGIELEVSGISKEQAAEALQAAGIETVAENYNHRTRNYWKATTDSSIRSDNGLACEIVSPPLPYRESSFLTIAKVVAVLTSLGANVNDTCGMHVHVDCRNITDPDFYRLLLTFYSKFEGEIDSFVHSTRRDNNNNYCRTNKSLYDNWERLWSNYVDMAPSCLTDVFSAVERYHKLNFASYVRHGTVEFRQYQGTLDAKSIRAWVDFCISLVDVTHNFVLHENKRVFRPAVTPSTRNAPQIGDYIVKIAENIKRYREDTTSPIPTNSYEALGQFHELYRTAVRRPQRFSALDIEFTNDEINTIFKFVFFLAYHIATRTNEQNIAVRSNGNDISLRDTSFVFDDDFMNQVTSIFFGFHGTKEDITRKVNSKLTNLGILRNGHVHIDNDFYTCFEWIIDRNNVSASNISRNKYYLLIFGRNNISIFKNERLAEINRMTNSFVTRTRRFFVNNPRNLRDVISGNFARSISLASELVYFVVGTSFRIKMWNDESEISYTDRLPVRTTPREATEFRSLLTSNRYFSAFANELNADAVYSFLNSNANYEAVGKQPYFEFVDRIRGNEAIASAFSGLSDTSKVAAVRGEHGAAMEIHVNDSIRRAREFIEARNAPRPAPAPIRPANRPVAQAPTPSMEPRVVSDLPLETDEMIRTIRSFSLPSEQEAELISTLNIADRPINVAMLQRAVLSLREQVIRQRDMQVERQMFDRVEEI